MCKGMIMACIGIDRKGLMKLTKPHDSVVPNGDVQNAILLYHPDLFRSRYKFTLEITI